MSMLLGFRSEILASADALEPRNLHNGATWPYPPTMLMRIMDDEKEVVERCNKTIVVMNERVRGRARGAARRAAQARNAGHLHQGAGDRAMRAARTAGQGMHCDMSWAISNWASRCLIRLKA